MAISADGTSSTPPGLVRPGQQTTFKATNWSQSELITQQKANVSNNNIDWLFRNTPRAMYTMPGNTRRAEGLKITSGKIIIAAPNDASAMGEVAFGSFFSTGCEPHVTTGVLASFPAIACAVGGIGQGFPDHRGIRVKIQIADWYKTVRPTFGETVYVSFIAMGY